MLKGSSQTLAAAQPNVLGSPSWKTALSPVTDDAHDALLRGQSASLLARRASESRLAVDLGSEVADLTTVPAPARWVDNVFGGRRSVVEGETPLTYGPSYLKQYNETLRRYLNAYAVAYPHSLGTREHVVSLSSALNSATTSGRLVERLSARCTDGSIAGPQAGACHFHPPQGWSEARCAGRVSAYTVSFSVDAAATNAFAAAPDATPPDLFSLANVDEFNFRIVQSGLNVIGTNVSPSGAGTGYGAVDHKLEHDGQALVSDARLTLRGLALPYGLIASGKARTGGSKLTVPLVGDPLTSMDSYLFEDVKGRPPGGTYTLTLSTKDATLCRAEDVELYFQLLYWVRNGC